MLRQTLKELGIHSFIYLLGGIVSSFASIFLLPIFTRFLSTNDYGIIEMIDSSRYLVIHLLVMGFIPAMAKFYKEADSEQKQQEVVGTSFSVIIFSTVFWGGLLLAFNTQVSRMLLGSPELVAYVNLGIALLCIEAFLTTGYNYLTIRKQSTLYVTITVIRLLFNVVVNLYFIVILQLKAKGMFYGELISNGILVVLLCLYIFLKNGVMFRWELARKMAGFGLPMLPNMVGAVLMQRADRYLLQKFTSLAAVGIYGIGYRFPYMLNYLILNSFQRIWNSAVMYDIAKQERAPQTYAKVTTYFMTLYVVCQYILIILAPLLIKVLAAPEYFDAWRVVQLVALGHCLYALHRFFIVGAFIKSKTWYLPISYLGAAFVNVTLNWFLLPRYGYMAGAWNVIWTYAVFSGLNLLLFRRIYPIPFEFRRLGKLFGLGIVLVLINNIVSPPNMMLHSVKALGFIAVFPLLIVFGPYFDRDEKESLEEILQKVHPHLAVVYRRFAL